MLLLTLNNNNGYRQFQTFLRWFRFVKELQGGTKHNGYCICNAAKRKHVENSFIKHEN